MLRSLKLSKANSGAKADPVQASREQALRAARDEAELALASAKVERKQLEARVAELEGKPAERDHAARVHALDGATAKLQSLQESAAHDQALLRDEVAQRDRTIEQLEHRLQGVGTAGRDAHGGAAVLSSARRRWRCGGAKARYVSDDRLRVAESRAEAAGRRAHAAERQVAAMAAGRARWSWASARGAAEVASAERDDLRVGWRRRTRRPPTAPPPSPSARRAHPPPQAVTGGSVLRSDMSDSAGAGDAAMVDPAAGRRKRAAAGRGEAAAPVLARRLWQQAAAAEAPSRARPREAAARARRRWRAPMAVGRVGGGARALKGALLAAEASAARGARGIPAPTPPPARGARRSHL